ncbi:hypothetical protein TELCIR_16795, partial [Teladorsagia circumcincta]
SLWISDTACAALMAPIAYALLEAIMIHKMAPLSINGHDIALQDHGEHAKRGLIVSLNDFEYNTWKSI